MDSETLRQCLSRWVSGVAVVTVRDAAGELRGLTVNSFSSVSLDPPLILWSVARTAQSCDAFANSAEFAVHALADDQAALARRFAKTGGSQFEGLDHASTLCGTPLLQGVATTLVCSVHAVYEGGNHLIIVGRVASMIAGSRPPLIVADGTFRIVGSVAERAIAATPDAALLLVGDELLSGKVTDANGPFVARALRESGIELKEIHILGDDPGAISAAVRERRLRRTWTFVVGGLGPTHDDRTAAAIADALGLPLERHPDAVKLLELHHAPDAVPPGRLPATDLPSGCQVLPDRISGAAGFRIDDVIAISGVPEIASSMIRTALARLPNGVAFVESAVNVALLEPDIAADLGEIQSRHAAVKIGCYPYFGGTRAGVNLVLRSSDVVALQACEIELKRTLDAIVTRRQASV